MRLASGLGEMQMIDLSMLRERPWLIGLLGASVVIILFFMVAATVMPGGLASPPQSDTLMYFQYAQALAHGHPYQYQAGDPCTTASTSHLDPLLLALPCWLGAQGASLVVCSLALNVFCYLAVVMLAGLALRRLAPEALPLGVALVALCGPLALVCLQQSDMGLFTALALGLFVALVYARDRWAAVALTLAVWCRPEGSVMAGLLLICALLGAERLINYLEAKLGIKAGETTADGLFTLIAVECLASCGTAPAMQINDTYHEQLTEANIDQILKELS